MRDALIAAMQATAAEKPRAVVVPKWGEVFVRSVTVAEIEEQSADTAGNDKHKIARGVARVLCDADGKLVFDPTSQADIELIAKQPWKLLRKVLAASDGDGEGN